MTCEYCGQQIERNPSGWYHPPFVTDWKLVIRKGCFGKPKPQGEMEVTA